MNLRIISTLLIALSFCFLNGCKKNVLRTTETFLPDDKAFAKFFFGSPGTNNVMIKVNDEKINGLTQGYGSTFPFTTNFPDYVVMPVNGSIKIALPFAGTKNDSVVVLTTQFPLEVKKYYSLILADTGIDRTLFSIIDDQSISVPIDSFYNIRLINSMAKSPNLSLLRIDSTTSTSVIRDTLARNIAYKEVSGLFTVPVFSKRIGTSTSFHSFVRYRLIITATGMNIGNLVTPAQSSAISRRNTSIFASGFANGTLALAPTLSSIVYNK